MVSDRILMSFGKSNFEGELCNSSQHLIDLFNFNGRYSTANHVRKENANRNSHFNINVRLHLDVIKRQKCGWGSNADNIKLSKRQTDNKIIYYS